MHDQLGKKRLILLETMDAKSSFKMINTLVQNHKLFLFFYGVSGRGRGTDIKRDVNSPWFGDNSPNSVLLSRA